MNKRLLIVFILGFSSGLPLSLLTSTLQAWYASSGLSVLMTGMLSLIGIPYVCRVLWGPFLDNYSLFRIGKRKSWIVTMQFLLLAGFNLMAWFAPEQYPRVLAFLALLMACCSATQDMAIDAHRVEYLPPIKHGLGASLASTGYRIALLVSGGLALVIAQHWGWAFTYRFMGLLMLIGMFAALYSQEPEHPVEPKRNLAHLFLDPLSDLLARPKIVSLLCFILFYKLGEAFTTTISGIVMPFLIQGVGFSLDIIGYVNKVFAVVAIICGGLLAGILLLRYSLYRCLIFFGLLQALSNVLFVALALVGKNVTLLCIAVFFDNFAAGMGSTGLIALLMRVVNRQFTGTQFSLLVAFASIPRIISGPFAACIQMVIGWVGLYQLSVVFALLFIPFLMRIKEQTENIGIEVGSLNSASAK